MSDQWNASTIKERIFKPPQKCNLWASACQVAFFMWKAWVKRVRNSQQEVSPIQWALSFKH